MKQCCALDREMKVRCMNAIPDKDVVCQKHVDELGRELWYQTEADRIISAKDHALLVEILRVRDSASAFYATCEMLLSDEFTDSDTVVFFDKGREGMWQNRKEKQSTVQ